VSRLHPHPELPSAARGTPALALFLFALAGLFPPPPVSALQSDHDQPIEVEADFAEFDEQAGKAVYKGNVIAVQGSIRVTGDVMTVRFTEDRQMKEVLVDGAPATFRQLPEGKQEYVEGEGLRVEYFLLENLVYLKRNAKLREDGKLLSGDEIIYDTARSVVTARKAPEVEGKAGAAEAKAPRQRVRVVLPPRREPGATPSPEPAAPPDEKAARP
jgi:lipopolysaccharide export system protein LptA